MADTSVNPVRLDPEAKAFYQKVAEQDSRPVNGYLRLVLETVASLGYTWQDLKALPPKR